MAAPSKNFTNIADTQIDADSPIDTTLMTAIRDSLVNVKEWLGNSYTAAIDHNHNGINSKVIDNADIIKTNAVSLFDDFLDPNVSISTKTATIAIQNAVNGVCRITNATSTGTFDGIFQSGRPWKLSSGMTITAEIKTIPVIISGAWDTCIGLLQGQDGWSDEIAFILSGGSANWKCVTRLSSGGTTTTDSGVAEVVGTPNVLKIVATPSSVLFYIDGVLKATHTTNIPTTNLGLCVAVNASRSMDMDYVNCYSSGRM